MHLRRPLIVAWLLALAFLPGCGPAEQTGTVQEQLQEGWHRYTTGSFGFAEKQFKSILKQPDLTDEAKYSTLLGLATTYHYSTNPDFGAARAQYEALQDLPLEAARRQALLGLALVDLQEGNPEAARVKFIQLTQQYPDSLEADEGALHRADSLLHPREAEEETGDYTLPPESDVEKAMQVLLTRLSERPDNPLAAVMHLRLSDRYIERKAWREAIDHMKQALAKGITSSRTRSATMWSIARIAEKELKDYALAAEYYETFTQETKRHVLYYRATQSLERVRGLMQQPEGGSS